MQKEIPDPTKKENYQLTVSQQFRQFIVLFLYFFLFFHLDSAAREQFVQRWTAVGRDARRGDGDSVFRRVATDRGTGTGVGSRRRSFSSPAARVIVERDDGFPQVVASSSASEALHRPASSTVHVPSSWHCLTKIYLRFLRDKRTVCMATVTNPLTGSFVAQRTKWNHQVYSSCTAKLVFLSAVRLAKEISLGWSRRGFE